MSILDRAKKQLENRFKGVGEETIRVMDAVNEEPKKKEHKPKSAPKSKAPVEKAFKPDNEKFSLKNKIFSRPSDDEDEYEDRSEMYNKKSQPEPKPKKQEDSDSAFDYDEEAENDYYDRIGKNHKEKMKSYEKIPVPIIDEGKLQDILQVLQIPATFEIDSDIYLPDDLNDIAFDMQVPQGYETSEVDTFVSRVRISIAKFVELLTIRNADVAKLASVIDRLQVDISNIRLETEIANGINIMPTHDTEHIEQENLELKSLVKRLEEQLESKQSVSNDNLSSKEREIFEHLQDQLSLKDREIEGLNEELYNVKNQLSMIQESQDQESYFPQEQNNDYGNYQEVTYNEDDGDSLPGLSDDNDTNFDLPDINIGSETETDLPDLSDELFENTNDSYTPASNSVFEEEDESIEDFLMRNQSYYEGDNNDESSISVLDDNGSAYTPSQEFGTYYNEDDEEDELDKLQKWGHS